MTGSSEGGEPAQPSSPDGAESRARGDLFGPGRRRGLLLAWLAAATIFVFHDAFLVLGPPSAVADSIEDAFFDPQTTAPELAALVFLIVLYLRRGALRAALGAPPDLAGTMLGLGGGVLLLAWAESIQAPDLSRLALFLGVLGGGCWLGGRRMARALLVPSLALLISLPLPPAVLNQVVLPLQLATADTASAILSLLGQEHGQRGLQILRGDHVFYVIEGCSGLRSIFSLELAALLYVELVGRGRAEKLVLLLVAPFVAFVVNAVRVVILVLRELPSDAAEHAVQGVLMIILGVLLLGLLEGTLWPRLFRRSRAAREGPGASAGDDGDDGAARDAAAAWPRLLALAAGVTAIAIASSIVPRPLPVSVPEDRLNVEAIAPGGAEWSAETIRRDAYFLGSTRFRHSILRRFVRAGESVTLFVGAEDRRSREHFGWSPKTRIPGPGWTAIEALPPERVAGRTVERRVVRYPDRTVFVYHWREGYRAWIEEAVRNWLGLDRTPWSVPRSSLVLRLETVVDSSDIGGVESQSRLRAFVPALVDELDRLVERERRRRERRQRAPGER